MSQELEPLYPGHVDWLRSIDITATVIAQRYGVELLTVNDLVASARIVHVVWGDKPSSRGHYDGSYCASITTGDTAHSLDHRRRQWGFMRKALPPETITWVTAILVMRGFTPPKGV